MAKGKKTEGFSSHRIAVTDVPINEQISRVNEEAKKEKLKTARLLKGKHLNEEFSRRK